MASWFMVMPSPDVWQWCHHWWPSGCQSLHCWEHESSIVYHSGITPYDPLHFVTFCSICNFFSMWGERQKQTIAVMTAVVIAVNGDCPDNYWPLIRGNCLKMLSVHGDVFWDGFERVVITDWLTSPWTTSMEQVYVFACLSRCLWRNRKLGTDEGGHRETAVRMVKVFWLLFTNPLPYGNACSLPTFNALFEGL